MHALGWDEHLPHWLKGPLFLGNAPWQWLALFLSIFLAYALGRLIAAGVVRFLRMLAKRTETQTDDELVEVARRPLRLVIGVMMFRIGLELMELSPGVDNAAFHGVYTLLVIGLGWLVVGGLRSATDWVEERIGDGPQSTHSALVRRRLRTQLTVLRRIGAVVTIIVATAVALLQFSAVRELGMSLLASAGVAGIVVGLAAQKTLGAVIAGVQLSVAQPVRLGDSVTIEGEFGEIEEIHLTYVVVNLWDERRLVVPIARLLDQTFVNWTRTGAPIHGTVFLHVDYGMPLEPMRDELTKICAESPAWDKRRATLMIEDAGERSLRLRALVSATNTDDLSTLRFEVREKLVRFVQTYEKGKYLPRAREESVDG